MKWILPTSQSVKILFQILNCSPFGSKYIWRKKCLQIFTQKPNENHNYPVRFVTAILSLKKIDFRPYWLGSCEGIPRNGWDKCFGRTPGEVSSFIHSSGWLKFPRERGQLSILPMWPILPIWCWSKEKNVLWTSRGGRWVGWEWGKNSLVTCAKLARGEEGHTYTHLGLLTSFIIHSQLRRHPPISEDKKFQENVKLTSGCSDTAVCHFFEAEDFNLLKLNLHSFAESQTASALKVFCF